MLREIRRFSSSTQAVRLDGPLATRLLQSLPVAQIRTTLSTKMISDLILRNGQRKRPPTLLVPFFELASGGVAVSRALKRCRKSAMHHGTRSMSMTTVLLVTVTMAMSQCPATAQSSSLRPEAPSVPSIKMLDGSGASPTSFVQNGPSNQKETTLCSLRVPDAIHQPLAGGDGATPTGAQVSYPPCPTAASSDSFLKPHIRLTPSHQPALRRLRLRPRTSGRIMAGVWKVGVSDWVRLWRTQNHAGSSRGLLCRQSCTRTLDISPRPREGSSREHGIPRPGWRLPGPTAARVRSTCPSSWARCSPARYKIVTTRDRIGRSEIRWIGLAAL